MRAETKRKISDAGTAVTALPLETDSVQMASPYQAWAHAHAQPVYKESAIVPWTMKVGLQLANAATLDPSGELRMFSPMIVIAL